MSSFIHHVCVFVSNMEQAIHLFRDILAFDLVWRLPRVGGKKIGQLLGLPGMEAELAYMESRTNSVGLELSRLIRPEASGRAPSFGAVGSVVLSLEVEDLERIRLQLKEEGWTTLSPCLDMKSPDGESARLAAFRMEGGLTVELIERLNGETT